MSWLDKHMAEGKRIRDELNGVVVSFPDNRIPPEVMALNKYEGIMKGLGMRVPHLATPLDIWNFMLLPSTAEVLEKTIIFHLKNARSDYENQH